jgi:hypothetical protein
MVPEIPQEKTPEIPDLIRLAGTFSKGEGRRELKRPPSGFRDF